jgi:NADH-quinone oxidoreductase subunit A
MDVSSYASVLVFLGFGLVFVLINYALNALITARTPEPQKYDSYECGEVPQGTGQIQYNVRYFIFALIFVLFDVEVIFVFPWAVVFRELGMFAFVEMLIFLTILILGLVYAWRKGVLHWFSRPVEH